MELFAIYFLVFFVANIFLWSEWLDRTSSPASARTAVSQSSRLTRDTPLTAS